MSKKGISVWALWQGPLILDLSKKEKKCVEVFPFEALIPHLVQIGEVVWAVVVFTDRPTFFKNHFFGLRGPQNI